MKRDANRPWRKDHPRAALLLIAALLVLGATPAQASTGGASALTSAEASGGIDLAFAPLRWAEATWYGPGLYGNSTACGQVLRPGTIGVAHRSLPCGTAVRFVYRGHQIVTRVIDRGPYSHGNDWDLTHAAARALRFDAVGAGRVGFALSQGFARSWHAKRRAGR